MITLILRAMLAFVATNVDDLVLVMILGAEAGKDRRRRGHIWAGQLLATGLIVVLGVAGALLVGFLPAGFEGWLRYLGLLPIFIGLWHIAETMLGRRKKKRGVVRSKAHAAKDTQVSNRLGVGKVFFVLFSACADNAGVYIPLFSQMGGVEMALCAGLFMTLAVLFCALALKLAGNTRLETLIQRYEAVLVPVVLILIGVGMILDM